LENFCLFSGGSPDPESPFDFQNLFWKFFWNQERSVCSSHPATNRSSVGDALFLMVFARKDITVMFCGVYPRLGFSLSREGELGVMGPLEMIKGIPSTGQNCGITISLGVIVCGTPCLIALCFAASHRRFR
jgi:hypothetical protein